MFGVKWVVHRHETQPVEVENIHLHDLDKVMESCQARLSEMRRKQSNTPPDGFLVFDSAGDEVRRWFESARLNLRQGPGRR
jgi:hypothetical protein